MPRTRGHPRRIHQELSAALLLIAAILLSPAPAIARDAPPPRIAAGEAEQHIGEVAEVCGRVASAAHFASVKGRPTFLNLERPYPDQLFTIVIWESARALFDTPPERLFDGRSVCVTGRVETYRGKPQIVVEDPGQIVAESGDGRGDALTELERVFVKAVLSALGHEANYGTGEWDQQTVEAVVAFQESAGVDVTGDPDAATMRALAGSVAAIPDAECAMVIRLVLFELARRQD